jgi:ubiquitin carboxyl-terminal hydrolase 36/42
MELETSVGCLNCDEVSRSTTTAFEIHIDAINLNKTKEHTVETVLDAHMAAEEIEDYKCDKCNKLGVSKRTLVSAPPLVLTVTVQRCGQGAFGKSNIHVLFDQELDIAPLLSPSFVEGKSNGSISNGSIGGASCMYDLYAVVVHLDIANSVFFGHYIAFVRVVKSGGKTDRDDGGESQWWRLDDDKVRSVSWDVVRSNRAYMLFYRQRD